ncbi:MAG: GDSL-type esterase/lipase family protein [Veillonellales bacterium]
MKLLRIAFITVLLLAFSLTAYAQEGKVQLLWQNAEDAVMYELEIATVPLRGNQPAPQSLTVYRTTEVYTPGIELDLDLFDGQNQNRLYYRVRPLDLDKNPIAAFTQPAALSQGNFNPPKPTPTAYFNRRLTPLYPVYSWIPVLNAARYEVEITDRIPENPNGTSPSCYRIRSYSVDQGFDCYDTHAYTEDGIYYWRVIAFDGDGQPLGGYSDAISFKVQTGPRNWAVFGDSITHGGGAISNPPSDSRFDYSSYLPFPVKNLGRSGDTAAALAERFESDVLPFHPRYLFILGGSNSIREGVSAEDVIESLEQIKQKCRANGITPIFLTLPPVNPERIARVFNQPTTDNWQEELAKVNQYIKAQTYSIDIYAKLVNDQGILPVKYAQDGLHPDIAGKKIMGRAVRSFLKI